MKLTYHRGGDYLYPNLLIVNETSEPLGKYGLMRRTYLKEDSETIAEYESRS